jgi:hypothetical protein
VNPTAKRGVDEWIKRRVLADAPMQPAAQGRHVAAAELAEPDNTGIASVLTGQHDQVTALIKQLNAIPDTTKGGSTVDQSRRASLVETITVVLSRHKAAEEEHLWPWMRPVLDDGGELAATGREREQRTAAFLPPWARRPRLTRSLTSWPKTSRRPGRKHVASGDRVLLALVQATSGKTGPPPGNDFCGPGPQAHQPAARPGGRDRLGARTDPLPGHMAHQERAEDHELP